MRINALIFTTVAGLLGACASMPQSNAQLEEARTQVQSLAAEPLAQQAASHDLDAARASLNQADAALAQHRPPEVVDHLAYLARRHADAGQARVDEARARQEVAKAQDDRNRILLQARSREAQNAQANAQVAQANAEAAQNQAQAAQQQLQSTQKQLQDLQAKQTGRGMVLTLGDVLFDTNKATLKPGADQRIDRLATFLQKNPNERLIIEGYTDSTGSEDYNQELSQRRAQSVADVLAGQGVPASRYQVVGKGQALPVATNATPAGRQQNRRVEVVFSDQAGRFAEAPEREGAQR
jgi:outer membrane protein OmpA-like peptidoglycan-associated protein